MRNLLKKALACTLTAALALSCLIGIPVSAETYSGTISAENVTIDAGVTSATVDITINSPDSGINSAMVSVASKFGAVKSVSIDESDDFAYIDDTDYDLKINEDGSATFIVHAYDNPNGFNNTVVSVEFESSSTLDADSYLVDISLVEIHAANWNEDVINLAVTDSYIVIHKHNIVYSSNDDGTHTFDCTSCDHYDAVTESCNLGDDNKCDLCPYVKEEEPEYVATLELYDYDTGLLSNTINYNSLADAMSVTFDYAMGKIDGTYYDPVVILNSDVTLDNDIIVGAYTTLKLGDSVINTNGYELQLTSSGKVTSSYEIPELSTNVFIDENIADNVHTYTAKLQLTMENLAVDYGEVFYMQCTSSISGSISSDVEYGLVYTKGDSDTVYEIPETYEDGVFNISKNSLVANTYGIRSVEMKDIFVVQFYAKTIVDGTTYYVYSNALETSLAKYAKEDLEKSTTSAEHKALLKAMLNYGSQAQIAFAEEGVVLSEEDLANYVLSAEDRVIDQDLGADVLVPKNIAPESSYTSTGYFGDAALQLEEAINVWCFAEDIVQENEYELLVWDTAEYNQLVETATSQGVDVVDLMTEDNCVNKLALVTDNGPAHFVLKGITSVKIADTYYVRLIEKSATETFYDSIVSISCTDLCSTGITNYPENANLYRAMAIYSQAARTRFSYNINSCD